MIKRKTAPSRLRRALTAIAQWCRANRHRPIHEQHSSLASKLRGHYQYYGITGNSPSLACFKWHTERLWKYWLERRSQRGRMTWKVFRRLLVRWPLPSPKVTLVV